MKKGMIGLLGILWCTSVWAQPEEPIELIQDNVWVQYAFYFLDQEEDPLKRIKKFWKVTFPEVALQEQIPHPDSLTAPTVVFEYIEEVETEYTVPDMDYLDVFGYGMSTEQKKQIQNCQQVVLLNLFSPQANLYEQLLKADLFMVKASDLFNVILWDEFTRECFTPAFWTDYRIPETMEPVPNIGKHTVMHFYQESEEFCRLITLGMSKFGLPDIVVENLSCYSGKEWPLLISFIAQQMLENPSLGKNNQLTIDVEQLQNQGVKTAILSNILEGGTGKATIKLAPGTPKSGDPDNSIVEIVFRDSEETNAQILQDNLIAQIFGVEDKVYDVAAGNEELAAASKRAKAKLPKLKKRFKKGLGTEQTLLMKFPFVYDEVEIEYMWVEILSWQGNSVEGILQNQPYYVPNLQAGQRIKRDPEDMYDYILQLSTDEYEGNETGEIILRLQEGRQ
ncbi:MAG: DUF2314 domain-containing protein [Bacteroidota bacterium]